MDSTSQIFVTMGDPHGVGPEVLLKLLYSLNHSQLNRIQIVGDPEYLGKLSHELRLGDLPPIRFSVPGKFSYPPKWGAVSSRAGDFAISCLETALQQMEKSRSKFLITAPIHKEAAQMAGFDFPGQTEYIASRFPSHTPAMAFLSKPLKVVLCTVHIRLKDVADKLSIEGIERCGTLLIKTMQQLGIKSPRIAVAGLNPHASESGQFGMEEEEIVKPAVQRLKHDTTQYVAGPFSPDTIFQSASQGEFDGVVALYHDQALIPLKLLAFNSATNVTLGLPIIRTSPCHGTGFDIAGSASADPGSMLSAFHWGISLENSS